MKEKLVTLPPFKVRWRWNPPPLQSEGGIGHHMCLIFVNDYATILQYDNIVVYYIEEMACRSPPFQVRGNCHHLPFKERKGWATT